MRHDFERDVERNEQASQPAPAPEHQLDAREQLASAVGNSAMQRAASSPRQAPPALLTGAPMSVARASASGDELEPEDAGPAAHAPAEDAELEEEH